MLNCIAVDDEPLALELLEDNIGQVPFLSLKARCKNAIEAMEVISSMQVDLVFLDIQMPGISGIKMLGTLSQVPMVIFITAYENFALEAFNLNAIDYLLKPVSFDRFLKAVNKANDLFQLHAKAPDQQQHSDTALPGAVAGTPTTAYTASSNLAEQGDYFFVNADYNLIRIAISDILYVEGLKDYIKINSRAFSRPVITRLSMKNMEEKLPASRFVRVHKSFIIAIDKITSIRKNRVRIGEEEIPVSDFYKENLVRVTGERHF